MSPGRRPGGSSEGLNSGERPGTDWIPAECDVSIRPGWFYHAREDGKVKTPAQLLDIYYASVGRGADLNLNIPPDRRGRIPDPDAQSLREFRRVLDATFARNLAVTPEPPSTPATCAAMRKLSRPPRCSTSGATPTGQRMTA